jgi:hypothetical protein
VHVTQRNKVRFESAPRKAKCDECGQLLNEERSNSRDRLKTSSPRVSTEPARRDSLIRSKLNDEDREFLKEESDKIVALVAAFKSAQKTKKD